MAVTFVNAGAEGSAATDNITLGAPASPQNGDIWVAVVHSADQVAHSMSGDWTQIVQGNGGGTTSRLSVWWFRYAGTTPSLVVTHSLGGVTVGGVAAFRGCVPTGSPVDTAGTIGTGTTATIAHPGITVANAEVMHLLVNGSADDNARTLVTNYLTAFEDVDAGVQNNYQLAGVAVPGGSVALMYRLLTGLTNVNFDMTQAAADPFAGVQVALKATADAAGSSPGVGTAPAVGASTAAATGSIVASATTPGTGASTAEAAGSSLGVGAAPATGAATAEATGSAPGAATTPAVGAATAEATGSSPGTATAPGTGASTAEAVGSLAGVAAAPAVGTVVYALYNSLTIVQLPERSQTSTGGQSN